MDLESVKERLAALGYTVTAEDETSLAYSIGNTRQHILNQCNIEDVPDELIHFAVDAACADFLSVKRVTGNLDETFNIEQGVTAIKVGDTNVSLNGQSKDVLLNTMLQSLRDGLEREMLCFRKIRW